MKLLNFNENMLTIKISTPFKTEIKKTDIRNAISIFHKFFNAFDDNNINNTCLKPTKNNVGSSNAERDGAVGGLLEWKPEMAIKAAINAGTPNRVS